MGYAWKPDHAEFLEDGEYAFDLKYCKLKLKFRFDTECSECFPRKITQPENTSGNVIELNAVDFAVLSLPRKSFQSEEIPMSYDTVDFNWFANPQNEKVNCYFLSMC